jgi:catechol 2,3-dioxygenase-like lactoylglutathione lyase family enzyme|tara:strand:+ start:102 stop:518 length:417 start_codon:yes stop_codon:yes gene_type:complete
MREDNPFRPIAGGKQMELGAFSVSLAVKDIGASRDFYEKLGFSVFGGDAEQGWLIMKSPTAVIGLFQGMFEKNILTFNPGWDSDAQPVGSFTDIREIQKSLKAAGVRFEQEADETGSGPASCTLLDPDGNAILIDQHV